MTKTLEEVRAILRDNKIEYLIIEQSGELVKINLIVKTDERQQDSISHWYSRTEASQGERARILRRRVKKAPEEDVFR